MTEPTSSARPTDVGAIISDLEAGQLEAQLGITLSEVAAAVTLRAANGKVSIELEIKPIPGTRQVQVAHTLKFKRPTLTGSCSEDSTGTTVFHVGQGGQLSIAQAQIPGMRQDQIPA